MDYTSAKQTQMQCNSKGSSVEQGIHSGIYEFYFEGEMREAVKKEIMRIFNFLLIFKTYLNYEFGGTFYFLGFESNLLYNQYSKTGWQFFKMENENKPSCCAVSREPSAKTDTEVMVEKKSSDISTDNMIKLTGRKFLMETNDEEGFPDDGEGPVREITLDFFLHGCDNSYQSSVC